MTVISVKTLEKAKDLIESGFTCDAIPINQSFCVDSEAVQWLKKNHYHLEVAETFGKTGIALLINPAK